ncbi:MAG: GNAT family N-acetyltransferase [Chloroflexales bacterium]
MIMIEPLQPPHLSALVAAHAAAPPGYSAYFQPFPFDEATLRRILERRREDLYYGVIWAGQPAGLSMLRGFDQGYRVPSYGVWIAPAFSRRGLGRATLQHAVETCRARGCAQLMLKVHPLNTRARQMYERFGFVQAGVDPHNQNLIYRLTLGPAAHTDQV